MIDSLGKLRFDTRPARLVDRIACNLVNQRLHFGVTHIAEGVEATRPREHQPRWIRQIHTLIGLLCCLSFYFLHASAKQGLISMASSTRRFVKLHLVIKQYYVGEKYES